jgi:hypothetical protein
MPVVKPIYDRAILQENFTREELAFWFERLDDLRLTGQVNMFGSAGVLEGRGFRRKEAQAVARAWMATFSSDRSLEARVEEAYEEIYSILKN